MGAIGRSNTVGRRMEMTQALFKQHKKYLPQFKSISI
jgi:hypothetical protein